MQQDCKLVLLGQEFSEVSHSYHLQCGYLLEMDKRLRHGQLRLGNHNLKVTTDTDSVGQVADPSLQQQQPLPHLRRE